MNEQPLQDKVVIVTGASRGIGRATALLLSSKGAHVVLASRDAKALQELNDLIKHDNRSCTCVPTDVRQENSVKALVHTVLEKHMKIDILINNAGVAVYGPVSSATIKQWNTVMETNLKSVFLCTREAIPIMTRQGYGSIICVASQAGRYGFPNLAIYCASKYGVVGFCEVLSRELKPDNIKVSCLCPGYVRTSFLERFPATLLAGVNMAEPEQIAHQIYELIVYGKSIESDEAYFRSIVRRLRGWLIWK